MLLPRIIDNNSFHMNKQPINNRQLKPKLSPTMLRASLFKYLRY